MTKTTKGRTNESIQRESLANLDNKSLLCTANEHKKHWRLSLKLVVIIHSVAVPLVLLLLLVSVLKVSC